MSGLDLASPLLVGFGITSRAVARALVARGHRPAVLEDRPGDEHRKAAAELGIDLVEQPGADAITAAVAAATVLLPSPGVPDHHPVFAAADAVGLPVASEFDLAQAWDDRPVVAITGTNGKTSVTMMVTDALDRSDRPAMAVGNTDVPFVEAIDDPTTEIFVVEASSFRLAHSDRFRPRVAAWLNFAPDHLDAHATLEDYEAAKASIWSNLAPGSVAVVNLDDPVVAARATALDPETIEVVGFSLDRAPGSAGPTGVVQWGVSAVDGRPTVVGPIGPLIAVDELARRQPHDVANALATAALAMAAGATVAGLADALEHFTGLPHRLQPIGSWDGIDWFDDSKATVPHATVAAVGGFESVVLIAGGHPKGLSFDPLRSTVPPVRTVVAIGTAAPEIEAVFGDLVEVTVATTMDEAIEAAAGLARSGDAVVLSPACASFDWYRNYEERGDDFRRRVQGRFGPGDNQEVVSR